MNHFLKIITILFLVIVLSTSASAVDAPKEAKNQKTTSSKTSVKEPPIRRVILPAEKPKIVPLKRRPSLDDPVLSPFLSGKHAAAIRKPLKDFRKGKLSDGIKKMKKMLKKDGYDAEVASFYLADFYMKQSEKGDEKAQAFAMSALQSAIEDYPQSDLAAFGHFRMGQIYASQNLYHEAIGSFTRIIEAGLDDPFILKAKIGIAKAYQAWGRWAEAQYIYERLLNDKSPMPSEDKAAILFGYADALYQRGQFYAAAAAYKKAISEVPDSRFFEPTALFQWGEAAYRARVFDDAKMALLDFYNIYPKDPLAAVALVRVKTILNLEKKANPEIVVVTPKIASIEETVHRLAVKASRVSKNDPAFNLGRILLSIDALKKCKQNAKSPSKHTTEPLPCKQPLVEEAFYKPSKLKSDLKEKIKTHALEYLAHIPPTTTAQGILLEAIYQLKKYNEIEKVVAVEATLLVNLPATSPYFREVEDTLHKTILTEFDTIRDPEKMVTLFHSYPGAFTKEMLQSEIGYLIAMSHVKTGLLSKAVALLTPVSGNFRYPLWKEALYQKGKAQLALANYGDAEKDLEFYQKVSLEKEKAYADLGDLHFKRGDVTRTISSYEKWLSHFPKHADRPDIYLKLSEAYRYRADYDNEIKVYSKWIAEGGEKIALPTMRLADTYFQLGEYKKAISSYRKILDEEYGGSKEMEWATFRLATSYELSGQEREGQKYFKNISQKTKDGLMRDFAQGKSSPF